MDARLGAPLVTQRVEGVEDRFGKAQQIYQDGAVESLASVVLIRLVGR